MTQAERVRIPATPNSNTAKPVAVAIGDVPTWAPKLQAAACTTCCTAQTTMHTNFTERYNNYSIVVGFCDQLAFTGVPDCCPHPLATIRHQPHVRPAHVAPTHIAPTSKGFPRRLSETPAAARSTPTPLPRGYLQHAQRPTLGAEFFCPKNK